MGFGRCFGWCRNGCGKKVVLIEINHDNGCISTVYQCLECKLSGDKEEVVIR